MDSFHCTTHDVRVYRVTAADVIKILVLPIFHDIWGSPNNLALYGWFFHDVKLDPSLNDHLMDDVYTCYVYLLTTTYFNS